MRNDRRTRFTALLALAAIAALGSLPVSTQDKPKPDVPATTTGASTYRNYCASCHGTSGKGDGPMADYLKWVPVDLTQIRRKNGGQYPVDKLTRIIDGRKPLKGHGGPEMPIWGDAFKNAWEGYDEVKVKEKIDQLVAYLETLQAR